MGEALDEILSFSMDVSDEETKEPFSVQSHKDIVISCCWLHIKVRSWGPFVFDNCYTVFVAGACKRIVCDITRLRRSVFLLRSLLHHNLHTSTLTLNLNQCWTCPAVVTFSFPCVLQCACQLLAVIFEKNTVKPEHMSMATLLDEKTLKLVAETACKVILQCRHQVLHCCIYSSF